MQNYKTVKQLAKMYGVTEMTIHRWSKKIPYKLKREIGKKAYKVFKLEDVENYIADTMGVKDVRKS